MEKFDLILIAILAIPVLILELLYERHWLRDIYMASKMTTLERFHNDLKRFREYDKKVRRGQIKESKEMRDLRINKGTILMFWEVRIFLNILSLYIFGAVLMIFYVCVTRVIWGSYPFAVVFATWCGISVLGIMAFPKCWQLIKEILAKNLDQAYDFFKEFDQLQKKEKMKLMEKEEQWDEKHNNEVPDWAVLVAVILCVVACGIMLYDFFSNMDDWHALFGIAYLTRPSVYLALGCLIMAFLVFFIGKIIVGWNPVREAKEKVTNNYKSMCDNKVFPEIDTLKQDIDNMCQQLGIKGVEIKMVTDSKKTAAARAYILRRHEIYFGCEYYNQLNKAFYFEMFHDIILLIIGHELAHLKALDSYAVRNRKLLLLLVFAMLVPCIFLAVLNMFGLSNEMLLTILTLVLLIYYIFLIVCFMSIGKAWADYRCQGQVNELRADRIGLQVSGVKKEVFVELARFHQKENVDIDVVASASESKPNWKEKLDLKLNGTPVPDIHPSWKVRVQEIRKYGDITWSLKDDIRYSLRFIKNLKLRKDWRL